MSSRNPAESLLDPSQMEFCRETHGNVRLLAPAGSGKTTSLLWRCRILADAAAPDAVRVLIFTFTRVARDELRQRLRSNPAFAEIRSNVEVSTLNAWGFRRLKNRLHNLRLLTGLQEKYWMMANNLQPLWATNPRLKAALTDNRRKTRAARDLMDLMDTLKGLGFRHDVHASLAPFLDHVRWLTESGMKARVEAILVNLEALEIIAADATQERQIRDWHEHFVGFWADATRHMYDTATITLEDQKYWSFLDITRSVAEGRYSTGMHRFHHIFVDEFQDVNPLDLALVTAIGEMNKCGICIVGDDDQAIYEWRGATPEFILGPDRYLAPGFKSFTLRTNYRSPANIVERSQRLINNNRRRVRKDVEAASTGQAKIAVVKSETFSDGIEKVNRVVQQLLKDPAIRDIALIGRKRSQIIPYQIVFASEDVPFYAAEDLHVLLSNTFESLREMLVMKAQMEQPAPFGPDPIEAVLKLCDRVKRYPLSKADRGNLKQHLLAARPRTVAAAIEAVYSYRGPLKQQQDGSAVAASFYRAARAFLRASTVSDALHALSDYFEGLQKDYGKSIDDIFFADPPFLHLAEYAKRYEADVPAFCIDLDKAISTLARISSDDDEPQGQAEHQQHRLHLMTALRAKGKEFDAVVILDCNHGIWPSKLAQTETELEAERRLFYVAFTRVRKRLYLAVNNQILDEMVVPSPYLSEAGISA